MSADLEWLDKNEKEAGQLIANALDQKEKAEFQFHWQLRARREQCMPPGDWRIWMIMAGRGFGKTRAGAEWVRQVAEADPTARIALVSASLAEARAVMVEGESGLLAVSPPDRRPQFEPSLHRVRFGNGALAQLFSAAEPEGLRGPQHSHAWSINAIVLEPVAGDLGHAGPAGRDRDDGRDKHEAGRSQMPPSHAACRRKLEHRSRSHRALNRPHLAPFAACRRHTMFDRCVER